MKNQGCCFCLRFANGSEGDTALLAHEFRGSVFAREEFVQVLEVILRQNLLEHGHALAYVHHPVKPWFLPVSRQPGPAPLQAWPQRDAPRLHALDTGTPGKPVGKRKEAAPAPVP